MTINGRRSRTADQNLMGFAALILSLDPGMLLHQPVRHSLDLGMLLQQLVDSTRWMGPVRLHSA